MFSIRWTNRDNRERVIIAADRAAAMDIVGMVQAVYDLPSLLTDMSTGDVSFQHVDQPGSIVTYRDRQYEVKSVIPGLDMVVLWSPFAGDETDFPVKATAISR